MQKITSYDILKKKVRAGPSFWRGFLSYELGYKFLGISPREKPRSNVPEVVFSVGNYVSPTSSPSLRSGLAPLPFFAQARGPQDPSLRLGFAQPLPALHPFSFLSKDIYLQKIQLIKEKLRAGETYQVNFSQRFAVPVSQTALPALPAFPDFTDFPNFPDFRAAFSPADFFEKLSSLNPSPHSFFFETDDFAVISNSPELLVRGWRDERDGKKFFIETRPIKGTMPRGRTEAEDAENIQKLLASRKEEAELTMIVDLERNDLGRVCKPGTIHVVEHRRVEKYSHVIHTVSVIRGELEEGRDVFDVLEAMFPGGSITGCPKKRTMEIIDELEDYRRGVYCGSAGHIAQDGSFEFNIMIRTAFFDKRTGILSFNSGGGIVIDSDPEKEYEETLHKAAAFFQVLYSSSPSGGAKLKTFANQG